MHWWSRPFAPLRGFELSWISIQKAEHQLSEIRRIEAGRYVAPHPARGTEGNIQGAWPVTEVANAPSNRF